MRADAQRNRERLLRVAKEAFAEEGVAVPLDEIARRAGVGPGTLYRHFPTKEALFEAVVHERLHALIQHARDLTGHDDPGSALAAFLAHLVREAAPKQDLVDALVGSGIDVRAAVTATAEALREEIARLLARAQEAGAVRDDITPADLMALLSGFLYALRAHPTATADPNRTLSVLLRGLRPDPRGA
jgi:AcrR family transcriptional regulator